MKDVTGRTLNGADRHEWEKMNKENEEAAREAQAAKNGR